MKMTTPSFAHGQKIPDKHAYEDENISPALKFTDVPQAAKTLALTCGRSRCTHGKLGSLARLEYRRKNA